jgi:serine/threonine protein kinase
VGEGSFGLVRKAISDDGTPLAIKSFKGLPVGQGGHAVGYDTFLEFQREAIMHASLENKYLLKFYGILWPDYSIVLEFVQDGVLGDLLYV